MNQLIRIATPDLATFLRSRLPELSPNWWQTYVVDRLSFHQQRMVQERGYESIQQLDFAALLRVLDQNWNELSNVLNLPREGRTLVKELQTVRNKWAHLSAESMSPDDIYRDADTLGRLFLMIGAPKSSLDSIEATKLEALGAMASAKIRSFDDLSLTKKNTVAEFALPFRVGDLVALRSNPVIILPVIEVIPGSGECRYRVFQNNSKVTYYESQLQLPSTGLDVHRSLTILELRALLTSLHILSVSTANLFSLRSGRVEFVPYQYRPVLKLIRSDRPRLLIADEVGVGKTIEAGLIIKELRARTDLSSVLIICPKALVAERKWYLEMRRFDEQFTALDGRLLRHCLNETQLEGEWPEQYSKAILPFSLFDSDLVLGRPSDRGRMGTGLLKLDPPPKFDLVIVDEAHHIRNSETFLHQGVRYFCDNAEAVLFLSATPVQLGSEDLYTLLNVLRPDLVIDPSSFAQMAEPNRHINSAVQHCRSAGEGWSQEARRGLDEAAATEWGRLFLRQSPAFQAIYDRLLESAVPDVSRVGLTREIEELYTFSPLINRTRRRDIGEFTIRKPETVSVEFTPPQKLLHDGLLNVVERILAYCHGSQNVKFMMTTIRRQAASCLYGLVPLLRDILSGKIDDIEIMEASDGDDPQDLGFVDMVRQDIESLLEEAHVLDPYDPKVEAFVKVLVDKQKRPNNKALVFSTFRHTLAYLVHHSQRTGLRVGLIHGDVPDADRSELRRRFALPKPESDALDVLLSSEVGCEGLDLQYCDFLVNYDLPWNPMRIEQRIGRIDRYGQKSETVAIVNFITPGTVDADIYERCLLRIGVFQHAIGGNEEILGEITKDLHDIAESFDLTAEEREKKLRQLSDNGVRRIREELDLESKQAELFGLNVPHPSWREDIKSAENYWLSAQAIQGCVSSYLTSRLGVEIGFLSGERAIKTLRLSQEDRATLLEDFKRLPRSLEIVYRDWEKWLKGDQYSISVTFDQVAAADDPRSHHLSVLHPLVRQAANSLHITEPGYVSLVVQYADITPGVYRFVLYRWKRHGVKQDESLVAVSSPPLTEPVILQIMQSAVEVEQSEIHSLADFEDTDAQHYAMWRSAQANHIAENRQLVEQRIQSLAISHRARSKALEEQVNRATNDKIRLMKQSELGRANADFDRRNAALQRAANSGDIHAGAVIFGRIRVTKRGEE